MSLSQPNQPPQGTRYSKTILKMKNIYNIIEAIAVFGLICFLIYTNIQSELLTSVFLTTLSSLLSWFITARYSKISLGKEYTNLIDKIDRQSCEKLLRGCLKISRFN
jgi:hypothetical protein